VIFYSPSIDDTYNLIVLVCIMFNNKITVLDDVWYHLVVSFVTDVQYHLVGLDLPDPADVPTRPSGCSRPFRWPDPADGPRGRSYFYWV
jgi:hypothetical protein